MALTNTPILAYDFTASLEDQIANALTLTLRDNAVRDSNGLLTGDVALNDYAFGTLPEAMRLTGTRTLAFRYRFAGVDGTTTANFCGVANGTSTSDAPTFGGFTLNSNSDATLRTRNGTTTVSVAAPGYNRADFFANTTPQWIFIEFRLNGASMWEGATSIVNETGQSWSAPTYSTGHLLWVGSMPAGRETYTTHFALWDGALTSDDRTALVADPNELFGSGGGNKFRPYFITG